MPSERLTFTNSEGHELAARCDLPDGEPATTALFAHCFTCTKNLKAVGNISSVLTGIGMAVLRFDFTGLGDSEGDFADTNFSTNVADLVAAAATLEHRYQAPQLLIGHSLGGAAVLRAAASIPSVRAVATIGAPCDPEHVTRLLRDDIASIREQGEAEVLLAGRPFRITKQFLDDLDGHDMREAIGALGRALLVLHSPIDNTVGIDSATEIFTAARHPRSFVSLHGADHLMSRERDSRYAAAVIGAWVTRYVS